MYRIGSTYKTNPCWVEFLVCVCVCVCVYAERKGEVNELESSLICSNEKIQKLSDFISLTPQTAPWADRQRQHIASSFTPGIQPSPWPGQWKGGGEKSGQISLGFKTPDLYSLIEVYLLLAQI